ncbi:hypothetical protein [Xenorhabdus sp. BG5]|nr:hypothetical protein [Xenorhabdus sp. BG5]
MTCTPFQATGVLVRRLTLILAGEGSLKTKTILTIASDTVKRLSDIVFYF